MNDDGIELKLKAHVFLAGPTWICHPIQGRDGHVEGFEQHIAAEKCERCLAGETGVRVPVRFAVVDAEHGRISVDTKDES